LSNGNYRYALKAGNSMGESVWSAYLNFTVNAPPPVTRFVAPGGYDAGNCLSSAAACATIQAAIGKSNQGDIVQVLAGTYAENIVIDRDVQLRGTNSSTTVIDGGLVATVVSVNEGLFVEVANLTIQHGASHTGGGIYNRGNLTVHDCVIALNTAEYYGGGVYNAGTLTLATTEIHDNSSAVIGGGILSYGTIKIEASSIHHNTASYGGGVYLESSEATLASGTVLFANTPSGLKQYWSGRTTIQDSTVRENQGAGIDLEGPYAEMNILRSTVNANSGHGVANGPGGTMTITNSTISGNGGNGVDINGGNSLSINSSTVAYNTGMGLFSYNTINLQNSIVAFNVGGNCKYWGSPGVTSTGNNLESGTTCQLDKTTDLSNSDPGLLPLENNGGYSKTHALEIRSPAIDTGMKTGCPATDQRGIPRPAMGRTIVACDIGAYELKPSIPSLPVPTSPADHSSIGEIRPSFSWQDVLGPSGATKYSIQLTGPGSAVKTFTFLAETICSAGECSASISDALVNGTYQWQIRAENVAGASAWTSGWQLTIFATTPGVPTPLSPDSTVIFDATPLLGWQAATNTAAYDVEVRDTGGNVVIAESFSSSTACKPDLSCSASVTKSIPAGGNYTWRIRGTNSGGAGVWSSAITFSDFITKPAVPVPSYPAGTISQSRPSYTWGYVPGAIQYQLQVKDSKGTVILTQTGKGTTITPNYRLKNSQYSFQVRAWNPFGWSAWSTGKTFVAAPAPRVNWYVSTTGNDLNDCHTPLTACRTIQASIGKAAEDDIIIIAAGTYIENLTIDRDITIQGAGSATIIDGNHAASTISVCAWQGFVEIKNLTVTNGFATWGGGIFMDCDDTVSIENAMITANQADLLGGGVHNNGARELSILNTTISNNTAINGGGGGISITSSASTNKIINSTVTGNRTSDVWSYRSVGGGIYSEQYLELTNSTVSGNTAEFAGGICTEYGDIRILNSTITQNTAEMVGGIGSYVWCNGKISVKNTIIAENHDPFNTNCVGPITSGGWNIEDGDSCNLRSTSDLVNTNPFLGPLQNNGGPTYTHALASNSPALDTAYGASCPKTDQRGFIRTQDGDGNGSKVCDRGAYERPDMVADKVTLTSPANGSISNASTIILSWSPVFWVDSEENYQLQIATDNLFQHIVLSASPSTNYLTVNNLANAKYYWRVRTSNNHTSWGTWSSSGSFSVNAYISVMPKLIPVDIFFADEIPRTEFFDRVMLEYYYSEDFVTEWNIPGIRPKGFLP
jgi:nitrous oxidase accessory protein NosD